MDAKILHLYYQQSGTRELHFNIQTSEPIFGESLEKLLFLIRQPGSQYEPTFETSLSGNVVEIGSLMHFDTTFSSKAVNSCRTVGLKGISRIECFTRYLLPVGADRNVFIAAQCDRMTEKVYDQPLETFETCVLPELTQTIELLKGGVVTLEAVNEKMGLGFNTAKLNFVYNYFVNVERRNPTDVELFMIAQMLSEHCRHGFFGAQLYIGGQKMTETLFQIIKSIRTANPGNSNRAFCDNASSIDGFRVRTLEPELPYMSSEFVERTHLIHITNTAETHNHPTGISAFAGAITGIIGELRDEMAEGRGSQGLLAYGGYMTAALKIPGYRIAGELDLPVSPRLETSLNIMIRGSNGVVDGANKYGRPVAAGINRTVDLLLADGERRAYLKPVLYVGSIGTINAIHLEKHEPQAGMKIVAIGGPAFRVGKGGGARSSVISTTAAEQVLDFDSVQRGDPEMQNGVYRVNRALVELGENSPVASLHDQGAGGRGNVIAEIVARLGGRVNIRNVRVGDKTMSILEIVSCEYQECMVYLVYPDGFDMFKMICAREEVHYEDLGEITGDGHIVFYDDADGTTPVNLNLEEIMVDLPQEEYRLRRIDHGLVPLEVPVGLSARSLFEYVCQQISVGSNGYLVHKGDQSVGGLVVQQQCCGPMQIPVSDVAVSAISYLEDCGAAIGLGESPLTMLVNSAAGTRMVIAEALLNICAARVSSIPDITYRANWMEAGKLPGEGPVIYDAAVSLRDLSIRFKIKPDGGKDSSSMGELVDGELIKAPVTLVLSAYAAVPDVKKVVTPDIKRPGESILVLLEASRGQCRLGGSALGQALGGQLGDVCPDIDQPDVFLAMLQAILCLHEKGLMLAYHDCIGDGGLIVTLAEMAMARNCGMHVQLIKLDGCSAIERLFAEEASVVVECAKDRWQECISILDSFGIPFEVIGTTRQEARVSIAYGNQPVFAESTGVMRRLWERTSYEIEKIQTPNAECAEAEYALYETMQTPQCVLTFAPRATPEILMRGTAKPKIAVLRTHGTNSDREMAAAFYHAGFAVQDVNMVDLKAGVVTLDEFHGLAPAGGFADADVFGSAKGWAASALFDERLREAFEKFRAAPNRVSFGECNGCQFVIWLDWILGGVFPAELQPRMVANISGRFEHRWPMIEIQASKAIAFEGMEGSRLVIPSAHGEGRFHFPHQSVLDFVLAHGLAPVRFVDPKGTPTEQYPYNPNGSPQGIAALCSPDGRHVVMMPHSTRAFRMNQCQSWMPESWKRNLEASPWLRMFQNLRKYC